ncbi:MAG TPA: class I SAM-dependent methyltransferase [Fimbriiglobus sp.]|jgi:SAM-dependent methyltransferase
MTATDRLKSEREFHDAQAAGRAKHFHVQRAELRFQDSDYLDHETWVRPAFQKLGDLRGKSVLDFGCGHGMATVVLARAGANVTAFDLSPGYVAEAKARTAANGVRAAFVVADGERLPYRDEFFDAVWGCAILHHLHLPTAARELNRVLKPGGVAAFCEPWGGNPMLALARRFLPYPGKHRTPDERPLVRRDLVPLREVFPEMTVEGYQLIGMVRRIWRNPSACAVADACDRGLLTVVPPLKNVCRYVVIALRKC